MDVGPVEVIMGILGLALFLVANVGVLSGIRRVVQEGYLRSKSRRREVIVKKDAQPFLFWFLILLLHGSTWLLCNLIAWAFLDMALG